MFRRVETSGKSVEDAVRIALAQLGCTREKGYPKTGASHNHIAAFKACGAEECPP